MVSVQLSGSVKKPGVYRIPKGARLIDLLERAGGLKSEAEISGINLSIALSDGDSVYIPKKGEKKEIITPQQTENKALITNKAQIKKPEAFVQKVKKTRIISLNTASKEELMSLPGIGEKTASEIIRYRSRKKFGSIYELKNIPRIGDKRMYKLKSLVTL